MAIPYPVLNKLKPMYGYQYKGFEAIHYHGCFYLMLDMGMGKSRICIEVGKTIDLPMFILSNKHGALDTWPDEFNKWDKAAKVAVLHGPNKEQTWANSDKYTNIILNYEGLKWFYSVVQKKLRPLQKYFFVFDESSFIKNHKSVRWKILHDMQPIMSRYRVMLSGTPTPQGLEDLWAQYYFLDGGRALGRSYYQFRSRFYEPYDPNSEKPEYGLKLIPGMEEKIYDLVRPITLQLNSEDYNDLPELIMNPIKVTLPSKLRRQYEILEKDFMLELGSSTVVANSSAVRDHKLRQFLQGAIYAYPLEEEGSRHRLPTTVEHIHTIKAEIVKDIVEAQRGKPILVAVQFKFEVGILSKVLGYEVPHLTGATTDAQSRINIKLWKEGKLPIMVVHPKSVAFSLNLQSGGNRLVLMALPWELDLYKQLLKRLWRPGQLARSVIVNAIVFKNTMDMKVVAYINRKDANQNGLFLAMRR